VAFRLRGYGGWIYNCGRRGYLSCGPDLEPDVAQKIRNWIRAIFAAFFDTI
jgi:hypothetical protein